MPKYGLYPDSNLDKADLADYTSLDLPSPPASRLKIYSHSMWNQACPKFDVVYNVCVE